MEDQIASVKAALFTPRERKSGFTPAWITQVLQNAMFPYFVLYIKKKERLEGALTTIEFLRERLATLMMAKDAHELRLAHETMNMILNAEMKLRAAEIGHRIDIHDQIESLNNYDEVWRKAARAERK